MEVSYRSIFGFVKDNKAAKIALTAYKQRLQEKEDHVLSLINQLAQVTIQVASVNATLEGEKASHEITREELFDARSQGEHILIAHDSIQREYLSTMASLKATKEHLNGALEDKVKLNTQVAHANNDIEVLRDQVTNANSEAEALRSQVATADSEVSDLRRQVFQVNDEVEELRITLISLEATRLQTVADLQVAQADLANERLEFQAKLAEVTVSLSATQEDLVATKEALETAQAQAHNVQSSLNSNLKELSFKLSESEKRLLATRDAQLGAEKALSIEHSKRTQNMEAFKIERALLMDTLNATNAKVDKMKRALEAADRKIVKELTYSAEFQSSLYLAETKNQELTKTFSEKERTLNNAVAAAETLLAEERKVKETALIEIERLRAALAAKEEAHEESCKKVDSLLGDKTALEKNLEDASRELEEIRVQHKTPSVEKSEDILVESDKENCEVGENVQDKELLTSPRGNPPADSEKARNNERNETLEQSLPATLVHHPFGHATRNVVTDVPVRGRLESSKARKNVECWFPDDDFSAFVSATGSPVFSV